MAITGGAGYIGSVTTELLRARGEQVVVLDHVSRGFRDAVVPEVPSSKVTSGDRELVTRISRTEYRCVYSLRSFPTSVS